MTEFQYPATAFFVAASIYIIALLRKRQWSPEVVDALTAVVLFCCYTVGQLADGVLGWQRPPASFWIGLITCYGAQQGAYKFGFKKTAVIKRLEAFRNGDQNDGTTR